MIMNIIDSKKTSIAGDFDITNLDTLNTDLQKFAKLIFEQLNIATNSNVFFIGFNEVEDSDKDEIIQILNKSNISFLLEQNYLIIEIKSMDDLELILRFWTYYAGGGGKFLFIHSKIPLHNNLISVFNYIEKDVIDEHFSTIIEDISDGDKNSFLVTKYN